MLHGGTVRTMDRARPEAAAVVVRGGRIAALLDDPDDAPAGARRIDLEGGCVLPGFSDAHVHFPGWALARRELRLQGARSLAEAVALVARAAAGAPPGTWVRGRGWRVGAVAGRRRAHAARRSTRSPAACPSRCARTTGTRCG